MIAMLDVKGPRLSLLIMYFSFVTSTISASQTFLRNIPSSTQCSIQVDSSPIILSFRGGSSDNDEELDAYVERLLSGVSDDAQNGNNPTAGSIKETVESANEVVDGIVPKSKNRRRRKKRTTDKSRHNVAIDIKEEDEQNENSENADNESDEDADLNPSKLETVEENVGEKSKEELEPERNEVLDQATQVRPHLVQRSPPPNALQRFLLSQGYIGRTLAALTILISEMIHRYLPELHRIIVNFSPESSAGGAPLRKRKVQQGVHSQYAAFASGSSVGGKKMSKDQKQQLDQVALNKLKHVKGGVNSGKYAHLSTTFMKRYNLGKYADEAKMFESMIAPIQSDHADKEENDDQDATEDVSESEDEEEDWVVQALSGKESKGDDRDEDRDLLNIEPTVSIGTKGVSVGLELGINFSKDKTKKKPQSVIDAARGSKKLAKTRKAVKVKGSDKDGGGGVLGRLRAAGANRGVSSRLLGAYPGDAVPIEEAASKYGVTELAERYGYGDWTDDDADDNDDTDEKEEDFGDEFDNKLKKQTRRRKRKKSSGDTSRSKSEDPRGQGRRRKRSSQSSPDFSMSFEFGTSSSSPSSRHNHRSRKTITRTRTRSRTSQSNDSHAAFNTRSSDESPLGSRTRDTRVRQPMERTLERNNDGMRVSRDALKKNLLSGINSSSAVQAPLSRTSDLKKKQDDRKSD